VYAEITPIRAINIVAGIIADGALPNATTPGICISIEYLG